MPTAHFIITGDFMTQQARDFVLDGEPGRAYRWVADGLGGSDAAVAAAIGIVTGARKLTGDSDDEDGLELEDDDSPESDDYRKQVTWLYAGRVRHKGQWYRPTGVITAWGPADAKHAGYLQNCASKSIFAKRRAQYYAPGNAIAELAYVPLDLADQKARERWVVFESCSEPPQWITPPTTLNDAVARALASGRGLRELGPDPSAYEAPRRLANVIIERGGLTSAEEDELRESAYAAEDAAQAVRVAEFSSRIREQAGTDVFDLTLLDGRVVQVPRAPFTHWALRRLVPGVPDLPEWTCVSEPGFKMCNDDPYHTDWILGAGLSLEESYDDNVSGPAWEHAMSLQVASVDRATA